ncbi:hypothetical protein OUZ56_020687 [Daphnia magna]|uniref:Uncharacterized protein n=1 Tax=Daphnia magna TaxID=35525 RepID=A0ABQ9ZFC9_9CRUS|nr:hypothetical protein OUZ56_020687 [Daphnia magna]
MITKTSMCLLTVHLSMYPLFWSGIKWNGITAADYNETIEFPDLVFSKEFTVFLPVSQKFSVSIYGNEFLVTIAAAVFLSCIHHNISFTSNIQMGFILFDLLPWMLKSTLVCRSAARPPTYGEAPTLTQPRRSKDQLRCVWHT